MVPHPDSNSDCTSLHALLCQLHVQTKKKASMHFLRCVRLELPEMTIPGCYNLPTESTLIFFFTWLLNKNCLTRLLMRPSITQPLLVRSILKQRFEKMMPDSSNMLSLLNCKNLTLTPLQPHVKEPGFMFMANT